MENRAFRFTPEEAHRPEPNEEEERRQRTLLEGRWLTHGDGDVEGVSREAKHAFFAEKLRDNDRAIAKLWQEAKRLEKLRNLYATEEEAPRAEAGFTEEEKEWFLEGENAEKMLLQASWETDESLDVDDVDAAAKLAFAKAKLAQLQAARRFGAGGEALESKMRKLELYVDQYGKEAGR